MQRATPAPSTPPNSSSSASSVATPGTESPLGMPGSSSSERISVTPERTAENRYYDPARGGYTNGGSSGSQSSQPSMFNADKMRAMVKKVAKTHRVPRGISGGAADNSSTDSSKSTMQSDAELIRLPPMGNFPPSSSSSIRKPLQPSARGAQRPANEKMGTGKRTLRRATSSLEPTSQTLASGTFAGHNQETYDEHTRKKQKTPEFTNPYKNSVKFCVGTFTNPHRASRDPSLPSPSTPYTKRRYDELVASQVEESQDDLLAVEAAGQLMELQHRDYDRDFAQWTREKNSVPKRRRSN